VARAPRWARAQIPANGADHAERIDIQVGRTGKLTPVRASRRSGRGVVVTNARCTMPTRSNARRAAGDRVVLQRAGDVIPQIVENLTRDEPAIPDLPDALPECDSDAVPRRARSISAAPAA